MNRHSAIRAAILAKLKAEITDTVTWFDGRPVFLVNEFQNIAFLEMQ